MNSFFDRTSFPILGLWTIAILVGLAIVWAIAPGIGAALVDAPTPTLTPKATPTPHATWTLLPTLTSVPMPPPPVVAAPVPSPTPGANTVSFDLIADSKQSGWVANNETTIHWSDRNLHVGLYKTQVFQSLLYFDVSNIVPGSKVLYAAVELSGLSRNNLGPNGSWTLRLLAADLSNHWSKQSNQEFRQAAPLTDIGQTLKPQDLAADQVNQFVFSPAQLAQLESVIANSTAVGFRLDGPMEGDDSLFTWDAGDRDPKIGAHPVLHLVVIPDQFIYVTETPTPQNVMTAAAMVATATDFAQRYGTATPFPRKYATMPPLMPITPQPTPVNVETVNAQAMYATAVAIATGTFTPTPLYWVTTTPLPLVIPAQKLSPTPTVTPTSTPLPLAQAAKVPISPDLYNKIIFKRGWRSNPSFWVMDADGSDLGLLTDRSVYDAVVAHDAVSPDGRFGLFNGTDPHYPDALQILRSDLSQPLSSPLALTALRSGYAFGPTWSPDGAKIAYTSNESGKHEIWILDANTKVAKQITFSPDWFWNQFPSWSPDGKQIVFSTDRGHAGSFTEIWIMNADGTNMVKLGDGIQDSWEPVWVKWKQ